MTDGWTQGLLFELKRIRDQADKAIQYLEKGERVQARNQLRGMEGQVRNVRIGLEAKN